MKPKKELGQNFLINETVINDFISFCNLNKNDTVLEIGPGEGALTKNIIPKVKKYIGVELDPQLAQKASEFLTSNALIFNENFLDLDLTYYVKKYNINKIIGAIPYYISSPIIHKIISETQAPLKEVYLITQKEFAEKVIGEKNKRSYFTNFIEKYASITTGIIINKESFYPAPKVDSMYFKFEFTEYSKNKEETAKWSKFLHHVFASPRKKINKRFDKEVLNSLNIDHNLRPENLSLEQIKTLQNSLGT